MKRVMFLLGALCIMGAFQAHSQCTPPAPSGNPGLSPDWPELPCIYQGVAYDTVINFENFDTVASLTIDSLRIDSIGILKDPSNWTPIPFTGIPSGLSYVTQNNTPVSTYPGGGTGCFTITGTTNAPVGNYRLGIYVTVYVPGFPQPLVGEADSLSQQFGGPSFQYFLKVRDASTAPACDSVINGIRNTQSIHYSGLGNVPNPFTDVTYIKFKSTKSGQVDLKVMDSAGKEVDAQQVSVQYGENHIAYDSKKLRPGVYFYSISNAEEVIMGRMIKQE